MQHVVYDVQECRFADIGPDELVVAMRETARLLGCTVLGELPVAFQPHGTTAVVVLAESHITVSTWPEAALAHVDVFTCRADVEIDVAVVPILAALGSTEFRTQRIVRAEPPPLTVLTHGERGELSELTA